ncbi:MAG TPA: methyltransferase, partial [Candidatus Saccharimonadales bacterium]|nr:methyltransferase [Candidatus Saccharimonadales bacterium]
ALRREIAARGLLDEVQLTTCGSLGLCERGPNMVVYPEGVWYSGVAPADVPEIVESHFRGGKPVERLVTRDPHALAAEIRANRDRALAAIRAREAAGMLPEDLMRMIRSYQESRIVLTAIELDVFTAAGSGSTAPEIGKKIRADARATELLLDALVALRLLGKSGGRYSATPVTERFLSARGERDARAAMRHQSSLWPRWARLTECVRTGTAVDYKEMSDRGDEWTQPFIAAMHLNAGERARVVIPAVGPAGIRKMLDVGGGSGAYSIAFAKASPDLRAEIFDLETVLPITRRHIEEAGLSDRVTTRAGDLRIDSFGSGFDLVLLSAICHAFDEAENRDLVRRCHEALAAGGRLVIQDFILDEDRTSPRMAALFSINMLVGTPGGRSYSESEYAEWMKAAGFAEVRRVPLPGMTDLVIGRR